MHTRIAVLGLVVASLWLGGANGSQDGPQGQKLTGKELHALLDHEVLLDFVSADQRIYGTHAYLPNGVIHSLWLRGDQWSGADKGTWVIKGDQVCNEWNQLLSEKSGCKDFYRIAEDTYQNRNGPRQLLGGTLTRRPHP